MLESLRLINHKSTLVADPSDIMPTSAPRMPEQIPRSTSHFCHTGVRRAPVFLAEAWGIETKTAHKNDIIEANRACYAEMNRGSKVNAGRNFCPNDVHVVVVTSILANAD